MAASADGRFVAGLDASEKLNVWSIAQSQPIAEPMAMTTAVSAMAFDKSGSSVLVGLADGAIKSVQASDAKDRMKDVGKVNGTVISLAVDASGQNVAVGDQSGTLSVWPLDGGNTPTVTAPVAGQPLSRLVWSGDGKSVFALGDGESVRQVDLQNPDQVVDMGSALSEAKSPATMFDLYGDDWVLVGHANGAVQLIPIAPDKRSRARGLTFQLGRSAIAAVSKSSPDRLSVMDLTGQSYIVAVPKLSVIGDAGLDVSCVAVDPTGATCGPGIAKRAFDTGELPAMVRFPMWVHSRSTRVSNP